MKYEETIAWLQQQLPMFSRIGAAAYKPGLDTSMALDAYYGHPHRQFKSIHIAGTNGKGSTSHMLASILQEAGYKTGLYTSPHLTDFRERMRVNGEMIPEEDVIDFTERFRRSGYAGRPSFFELTMMMAFDWFAKQGVDYAVIETGMGGRLDSTNIITPEACVITNIQYDHTQFLGDTLEKIAAEKAGIIKAGIPVMIGQAEGSIREVFVEKASSVGAPIYFAEEMPQRGEEYESPLRGDYQRANRQTVVSTIEMLRGIGIQISEEAVREGMKNVISSTGLRGRWMQIQARPDVICDTGHNEAGMRYNMTQLRDIMSRKPKGAQLRIVIGFVADKDVDKVMELLPREAEYYVTRAQIPRAMDETELYERFEARGFRARKYSDVTAAYERALSECREDDVVFVGGSTFVVADFLKCGA